MSNPTAIIGNSLLPPNNPSLTRKTFSRIIYSDNDFFRYGDNQYDPTYMTFDPTGLGDRFFMWVRLDDVEGNPVASPYDMVSDNAWANTTKDTASGFITAVNSVMPVMMIPSQLLVDNGLYTDGAKQFALTPPGVPGTQVFNWEVIESLGVTVGHATTDIAKYAQVGAFWGSQYVSVKAKDDGAAANNETILKLTNAALLGNALPTGNWIPGDGTGLVVGGAFCLMLNVSPIRAGTAAVADAQANAWEILIEFGALELKLDQTGALVAKYKAAADSEEDSYTVNLTQGKAKQGPPQQQHIDDGAGPYIIMVYPVWNGVVIMDGVQTSDSSVAPASTFVPKLKEPSILVEPYSSGFDPNAPAHVEVGVGTGAQLVTVDFGTEITLTSKGSRFETAYLPVFFAPRCWFDEWFIASDDIVDVVDFTYEVYAIWTKNGTAADLTTTNAPTVIQSTFAGPVADTSYYYIKWRLNSDPTTPLPTRFAGEIFGSIIKIEEDRAFPIKNGNGAFDIGWFGGVPGDPNTTGDWRDYVLSINTTLSIDGSSGNIVVDKHGVAGQTAATVQDVGALTISASGGAGTVAGNIFIGLAIGIGEDASSDGANWNIPLVGLERKLDDIALILAPFMDGFTFADATDYLTRYAGIVDDLGFADGALTLQVSSDIAVAVYDWKSGTSVRSALDEVVQTTKPPHQYVVRDGKIFFYELNSNTGLPLFGSLGPDWQPSYPNTRIMTIDQTPDFEDMRNEVVVIGLVEVPEGKGSDTGVPNFPRIASRSFVTSPDFPWAKSMVENMTGISKDETQIEDLADAYQTQLGVYDINGRITIPGNASIKPYDRWGNFVIFSVSHSMDFQSKTWTTDLELMAPGAGF